MHLVVIFFGFIAVCTTHYVLVTEAGLTWEPNWVVPLGVGFVINNLLVVNNYRDRDTDIMVGKKTIIVLLGKRFGILLYLTGFLIPCVLCPLLDQKLKGIMSLAPFGVLLVYKLTKASKKRDFEFILSATAVFVMLYGVTTIWAIIHR